MFDSMAYCPRCGARPEPVEQTSSTGRCPGCRHELTRLDVGPVAMLECRRCDGVWVDAQTFEQICANGESRAALLHRSPTPSPAAPETRVKYRPCVRCGKMMNRVNFARLSGTVVDVCRGHGTFLDSGELNAIVTFIHGGGLARMRQHEDEQRRLTAAKQTPAPPARTPAHGGSSEWDAPSLAEMLYELFGG